MEKLTVPVTRETDDRDDSGETDPDHVIPPYTVSTK
jgi:hypothetical protein